MRSLFKVIIIPLSIVTLCLSGCATQTVHKKSSVMEYLYPTSEDTKIVPSIPHLQLPLKVGIAFVPESKGQSHSFNFWTGKSYSNNISEAQKSDLLEKVADNFRTLEFVEQLEVIPSEYLTPEGSFTNLNQIKTMYGIDVIALVSYDQVQFTDENALSLSYWTIVGAYLISGSKNDTNTLMDTVVYDISSKKMLFRAPGSSSVKGKSTPINLNEELRTDSLTGFEIAAQNMVENLKLQLDKFQASLKDNPEQAKISHKAGYTGAGSTGYFELFVLFFIFIGLRRKISINKQ
ncbi:rhombotarget lipoprotein [Catenovulum sp. 2E275]|uniref:rhombotarget lipoprotein n=1 Tax=Catenovulum sp. 2E275 TaxID=2980497 RepID=UPI0021CE9969|nr:rhombotarget lipoprotein [Catenovulum sp. 2E275]MCU4677081.1 rhombotarget lipoprotein [Catenovulum sp. 2E275]